MPFINTYCDRNGKHESFFPLEKLKEEEKKVLDDFFSQVKVLIKNHKYPDIKKILYPFIFFLVIFLRQILQLGIILFRLFLFKDISNVFNGLEETEVWILFYFPFTVSGMTILFFIVSIFVA
jgi:hypothetical protein